MDEAAREAVRERAAGRCEYCHLLEAHVLTPFHVEHIVAKQHGGKDTASNITYACLRCNLHKGTNLVSLDPINKRISKLFNPRRHKWDRHFRWDGPYLVGKTAIGRTTVFLFAMNEPDRVRLREELIEQGLFPA